MKSTEEVPWSVPFEALASTRRPNSEKLISATRLVHVVASVL